MLVRWSEEAEARRVRELARLEAEPCLPGEAEPGPARRARARMSPLRAAIERFITGRRVREDPSTDA